MNALLILGGIAILLFVVALFSKRRFGVLGLALAAGSVLSTVWDSTASLMVAFIGIVPKGMITVAVTQALVVVGPAIVLLFHGVTYKTMAARVVGSFLFVCLAITFLITPLAPIVATNDTANQVVHWIEDYRSILISTGLVLAVADLLLTKSSLKHEREAKGKH